VEAVLRNPRSFTFPLGVLFSKRSLAGTGRVLDVLEFVPTAKSESSCTQDVHAALYGPMGQGEVKAGMNARLLGNLAEYLNKLGGEGEGDKIELFGWVKDVITKATAGALYGPSNPIATDSSLVDSLWYILPSPSLPSTKSSFLQLLLYEETYKNKTLRDFLDGVYTLLLTPLPVLTAHRAWRARKRLSSAFLSYYTNASNQQPTNFVKHGERVARKYNLPHQEYSPFEIGTILASVTNVGPTAFWLLTYISNDTYINDEVVKEVAQIVRFEEKGGTKRGILDLSLLKRKCPLLIASFHETLRLVNAGLSIRFVNEDTILDDRWLFKKGSVVQTPAGVLHSNRRTWGLNPEVFKPARFLKYGELAKEEEKRRKGSFIPFGGGKHLCPGRHLASLEICGFVALIIYGYDISMVSGGQSVKVPRGEIWKMGSNTKRPVKDVEVVIKRKEEFKDVMWSFEGCDGEDFERLRQTRWCEGLE
jgi:hypothetical protein